MAIAVSHLSTTEDTTNVSSYTSASISPSANALVLAFVHTSKATTPGIPTLSGNGLTWVRITGLEYETGLGRLDVFQAMGASPSTGVVTADYAGVNQTSCQFSILQATGVDTSGTNGSGAVVQSATNTSAASTLTVTLAAFGAAENATVGGFTSAAASTFTAGTGFTMAGQITGATPNRAIGTEYQLANDTTVDISRVTGTTTAFGGIGLEIKALSGALAPSGIATAEAFGTATVTRTGGSPVVAAVGALFDAGAGATAFVLPAPSNIAVGDLLIASIADGTGDASTITPPSGWTQVQRLVFSSNRGLTVYSKVAVSGDVGASSYTFTLSVLDAGTGYIARVTGNDSTNPVNVSAQVSNSTSTSLVAPSVTTTVAHCLLLSIWHADTTALAITPPGSMTEIWDTGALGYNNHAAAYESVAATGATGTRTATIGTTQPSRAITLAIAPAVSVLSPTGIATAEAFGTAVVTPGSRTLSPSSIATAESFGTAALSVGIVAVSPTGIATAQAFGTPVVITDLFTLAPSGIASGEAFGTLTIVPTITVTPSGITSAEALGTPTIVRGTVTVTPSGIATIEAFGTPTVAAGAMIVTITAGIGSQEALGTPALTVGPVTVLVDGIVSGEAIGTLGLVYAIELQAVGIDTLEVFGTPTLLDFDPILYFLPPTVFDVSPIYKGHDRQYPVEPLAQRLFRHFGPRERGRSVLKINGVYITTDYPTQSQMALAQEVYLGGHVYEVTAEAASALEAAGFEVTNFPF